MVKRWHLGFEMRVTGLSLSAAKFAGYSRDRTVWMALLIGGGVSGFAGVVEVTGNIGQLFQTSRLPTDLPRLLLRFSQDCIRWQ